MFKTIRKHPLAFLHAVSWVALGLLMIFIMNHQYDDYEMVPHADIVVTLCAVFAALIPLTLIIGVIQLLIRRKDAAALKEKRFLRKTAANYLQSRTGGILCFGIAVFAPLLPFVALFLPASISPALIDYTATFLFCALGLSIWLWFIRMEIPDISLTRFQPDHYCFQIQTGLTDSQLNDLQNAPSTLGISKHLWDGRKTYLYNMLIKEGYINEGDPIPCHEFSLARLQKAMQLPADDEEDESVIWFQLRSLAEDEYTPRLQIIKTLFDHNIASLEYSRYKANRSTNETDYAHSSEMIQLDLTDEALITFDAGTPCLLCTEAYSLAEDDDKTYLGCMLKIKGAQLVRIKYDQFNTWAEDGDTSKYDLSPEETATFYRLLEDGVIDITVQTLDYHPSQRMLALDIWGEPVEDGQEHSFFIDDGSGYLLVFRYDRLAWHWMDTDEID